jgi:hypothetical protein
MPWIFSAELEESPSPSDHGHAPWHTVRQTDTARLSYCPECRAVISLLLPSGMMFRPYVETCCRKSTSSPGGSPARTSALQEMERAWAESEAGYSLKSQDWLASYDRGSSSWKTCQLSLLEDSPTFVWPSLRSGTIVGGRLYQPQRLEPRTYESGGSYLPTPCAKEGGYNQTDSPGAAIRPSLSTIARKGLWPTPLATEGEKGGPGRKFGDGSPTQSRAAALDTPDGGQLNPTWVEWLMGYPSGWTVCADWATLWFRPKRERPSNG